MDILQQYDKDKVLYYFEEICKIPHGSENEMELSNYIVAFAKKRGLYCRQDKRYNVLVKKAGTKGYEGAPALIMQGHIDMVCEKNAGTEHDFMKDPLQLSVDGDFIYAKGTTLGADNGIAAAYMLALLDGEDIPHPPIEAVFTVEEEIGMGGATELEVFDLEGKRFLNLDTGDEGVLLSGCSGGRRIRLTLPVSWEDVKKEKKAFRLAIRGLKGGHSGSDIHLQRGNADCLMGRVLARLQEEISFDLAFVQGGNMDNAICREAETVLLFTKEAAKHAQGLVKEMEKIIVEEYISSDPSITITMEALNEEVFRVFSEKTKESIIHMLLLLPNGVQTMCVDMPGLVESSNNIGILKTMEDHIYLDNAVRSSVESRKDAICEKIQCIAKLCGAEATVLNDYPGWKYNPDSYLLKLFGETYRGLTGKEPVISAIHAGLECGLFSKKIPGLDMISIGPDLYDIHTPQEHVSISSTLRVWDFVKAVLKEMDH